MCSAWKRPMMLTPSLSADRAIRDAVASALVVMISLGLSYVTRTMSANALLAARGYRCHVNAPSNYYRCSKLAQTPFPTQ